MHFKPQLLLFLHWERDGEESASISCGPRSQGWAGLGWLSEPLPTGVRDVR